MLIKDKDRSGAFWAALRPAVKRVPVLAACIRFMRRWTDPHQRALHRLKPEQAKQLLQPEAVTQADRYPEIFAFVGQCLRECEAPAVLSYGCATGEEAFSLRRHMPHARVIGADINAHSIRQAQAAVIKQPDPLIAFVTAATPDDLADQAYDAIFCMAVLRHGRLQAEQPESCEDILSFAAAEALVSALVRRLKPGGYLAIWHAQFRFPDMIGAQDFKCVLPLPGREKENQPLYGPDNLRIESAGFVGAVFRKNGGTR